MESANTKSPSLILLPAAEIETLKSLGWRTLNVINGYGRFLRQKKAEKASALHEGEASAAFDENDDPFAELPL